MNSKDEIRDALLQIADSYEMRGEAVEMAVELVTYALFHEQVAIANTAKEMSLTDAYLMDSKIAQCANIMYSVYRGKNPTVRLNMRLNSVMDKSKFDPLYEGNTFNLYAADNMTYDTSSVVGATMQVDTILSKFDLLDRMYSIDKSNYMGLEVTDEDGNVVNNISDDIVVQVYAKNSGMDDEPTFLKEYAVTRIFADHCKSIVGSDNELIFALTIPGYGVRLFKKGNFNIGDYVRVKAIIYTPLSAINTDALKRVSVSGATLMEGRRNVPSPDDPLSTVEEVIPAIEWTGEVERQDVASVPYLANYAGRVNHQIQSNSDVNYLFSEVFVSKVLCSTFRFFKKGSILPLRDGTMPDEGLEAEVDKLYIWYIKKRNALDVNTTDIESFKSNYGNYFLNGDIVIERATMKKVSLRLNVVLDDSSTIYEEVNAILDSDFNQKLGVTLDGELLRTKISKLPHLTSVTRFELEADDNMDLSQSLPPGQYFVIEPKINYTIKR